MNGRPPKVGVIGAGPWGRNLIRNAAQMGMLAAVCDPNPRALEAISKEYPGVAVHSDLAGILRVDADGMIVAAPAALHAEAALAAIMHGKHVFVEKPLALNERDAGKIVEAAGRRGVQVMVGHLLLYHPAVEKMLDIARANGIGRLRHLRARRWGYGRVRSHENVWWSFAPHDVAVMLALFGDFPQRASQSRATYLQRGISDFTYTDFVFQEDRSAHLEAGWLDVEKQSRIDVFGERGVLSFVDSPQGGSLTLTPTEQHHAAGGEVILDRGKPLPIPFDLREPLSIELDAFRRAMLFGETTRSTGVQGVQVVRALAMAERDALEPADLEVVA